MGGNSSKNIETPINKDRSVSKFNQQPLTNDQLEESTKESGQLNDELESKNKMYADNISTKQTTQPVTNKKIGTSLFRKKDLNTTFTEDYGTSVNMVSFIGSVYSRLSYMNEHQFLGHYTKIFGPIIPDLLMENMNNVIKNGGTPNILNDEKMFSLTNETEKFGLQTYKTSNGLSLRFLPWAQEINKVNGEQRIDANTPNCDIETTTVPNENLVFATIATSNYGTTYVVGDKRMPNIVNVIFRGTSDAKSAGSYSKASSLTAMWTGNIMGGLVKEEDKEKFLYGIYKILIETAHTLIGAIKYVSDKINPNAEKGSVNVITTGHSLGGGLATIFAYVYVAHISNEANFTNLYPSLNINIGCFTYGSPRVLSKDLAIHFCELTTNNENNFLNYEHTDTYKKFIESINNKIPGRITYLRIVMHNDPVAAVPKIGYSHPCSDLNDIKFRKATNSDCLVQVGNSFSNRCRGTRLSMTYDFGLPLNCVNTKEDRTNGPKGPVLAKMPMGYHTEYLGISYIGGISLGNVFGKNIKRVNQSNNTSKKGDTVCRILIYPDPKNINKSLVGFYDLSIYRSKSNDASLNIRDDELENIESNEKSQNDMLSLEQDGNKTNDQLQNQPQTQNKSSTIFKNMTGISKIMVEVPEDIMLTNEAFEQIVNESSSYDIINNLTPPLTGQLIYLTNTDNSISYEGISKQNVGNNNSNNNVGGNKTKRYKVKSNKTKRNKFKSNKTKRNNHKLNKTKRNNVK